MHDTLQLPPRLFELLLQGSTGAKKYARTAALQFWGLAMVAAALGVLAPGGVGRVAMLVLAGACVFGAMRVNASVSLEPPNDLVDGLQRRHVALVLHQPERRGLRHVLFLRGPKERWLVRLPVAEATELLTLLSEHVPTLPVHAYDGARMREWTKHWASQPWQELDADPVPSAAGEAVDDAAR